MNDFYIISWNDDNHDKTYYLNNKLLGIDIKTVFENLIDLEIPKGTILKEFEITTDLFPSDIEESLFDYFQKFPTLDEKDIFLIVNNKWNDFYKKNIKKIIRKTIDK